MTVSSCADISLNPTGTYGQLGRAWKSVRWSVSSESTNNPYYFARNTSIIQRLLDRNNQTTQVIKVPQALLDAGVTYTFSLTVENFLGRTSLAVAAVAVQLSALTPQITILDPLVINRFRWQNITLTAAGTIPSCVIGSSPVTYSWRVYKDLYYQAQLVSSSLNPRLFALPAFSLDASSTYIAVVTGTIKLGREVAFATAAVTLVIGQSGLVAKISGAASRTLSSQDLLQLDASSSYDVDYPTKLLKYSWSCTQIAPSIDSCPSSILYEDNFLFKIPQSIMTTMGGSTYVFTVSVSNENSMESASCEVKVISVLFTDPPPAVLLLDDPALKYNADQKIVLNSMIILPDSNPTARPTSKPVRTAYPTYPTARRLLDGSSDLSGNKLVQTPARANAVWSCITCPGGLNKTFLALTPTQLSIYVRQVKYSIALLPNIDFLPGSVYTLKLSVSTAQSKSESTITIVMNSPPRGGGISVIPSDGETLKTTFTFSAFSWEDDISDLPLMYSMGYNSSDSKDDVTMIRLASQVSHCESVLGQGLASKNYAITAFVSIADIFECASYASTRVAVYPLASNYDVSNAAKAQLSNAMFLSDSALVAQVVSATLGSLNSVDCSRSPNCANLNRQICSKVAVRRFIFCNQEIVTFIH